MSAVELGKIKPSMKSLEFLAERLGRPTASLLEDDDARERELARLRADEAAVRRSKEPLPRGRPQELANGPADVGAIADREAAAAEARHRAGDLSGAVEHMRAALVLRKASRELAVVAEARREVASGPARSDLTDSAERGSRWSGATGGAPRPSPRS